MSLPKLFENSENYMYINSFCNITFLCLPLYLFLKILLSSFLASSLNAFFGITFLIANFWVLSFKTSEAPTYFLSCFSIVFICFSNALSRREYVNLVCSTIRLWSDSNISSPVRYSYLSILPYGNPDFFAASLLISLRSFSSLFYHQFPLLLFIFFPKDSFRNLKNYLL